VLGLVQGSAPGIDGFPNTHGSTSQLTPAEVADLLAFLLGL
jgi:hypothetical protein